MFIQRVLEGQWRKTQCYIGAMNAMFGTLRLSLRKVSFSHLRISQFGACLSYQFARQFLHSKSRYVFNTYSKIEPTWWPLRRAGKIFFRQEHSNELVAFFWVFFAYFDFYKCLYRTDVWNNVPQRNSFILHRNSRASSLADFCESNPVIFPITALFLVQRFLGNH